MSVGRMSLNVMSVDEVTVYELSLDNIIHDKMSGG
jgi:hypothetical protein